MNPRRVRELFSYCLSVYGPILWFIGFPAVDFVLRDQAGSKVLWQKS